MSLEGALRRFEAVMGAAWPEHFAELLPGGSHEDLQPLRDAVAPYLLPAQVEMLYRWRAGGDRGVFGGWRMRPVGELIDWYDFTEELDLPRVWLPVFEDQIVNAVTLDVPGEPPSDPSVWYGHTHDIRMHRMFDSIGTLLEVVCDAAEDGALVERIDGALVLDEVQALDDRAWTEYRLRRCPTAWRYPDPPAGTEYSKFAESDWPRPWRLAVGVTPQSLTLQGATHTIAELIEASAAGTVSGTIRARVLTGAGGVHHWNPVVSDGTGQLVIHFDTREVPLFPAVGQEAEIDVVLEPGSAPEPAVDDDPRVAAFMDRLAPPLPTAQGKASRPL